jgi:small conductance mechanosensitive channel
LTKPARRWLLGGLAYALVLLLALGSPLQAKPATGQIPASTRPTFTASPPSLDRATSMVAAGSYDVAAVRILGIPTLMVASPVVGHGNGMGNSSEAEAGPDAERRAQVIEGNLRLLYNPAAVCSNSERWAEWTLLRVLGARDPACDGGLPDGVRAASDDLNVMVRQLPNGAVILEATVPERPQPLPLLTVTFADTTLNGTTALELGQRWQERLQGRLRYARQALLPQNMRQRLMLSLLVMALVLLLTAGTFWLWRRNLLAIVRLKAQAPAPATAPAVAVTRGLRLRLFEALSFVLLVLVLLQVMAVVALALMAIPGGVPLALEVLLQPALVGIKVLVFAFIALLGRALVSFLLDQWATSGRVPADELARRDQRHHSLERIFQRLVDLSCIAIAAGWVVMGIPGVRETSASFLLAGGAVLGGLAIVFQGLLRDFAAGLAVLLEDRYAIGDWIEIGDIEGDVVDLSVLSTQLRCLDQRVAVIQNGAFDRVMNHTKIRSGKLVELLLSHRTADINAVLAVIAEELHALGRDPLWGPQLLAAPFLRGVTGTGPLGISVSMLITTQAGQQWACSRELQRRLLQRLQREGIPLASPAPAVASG